MAFPEVSYHLNRRLQVHRGRAKIPFGKLVGYVTIAANGKISTAGWSTKASPQMLFELGKPWNRGDLFMSTRLRFIALNRLSGSNPDRTGMLRTPKTCVRMMTSFEPLVHTKSFIIIKHYYPYTTCTRSWSFVFEDNTWNFLSFSVCRNIVSWIE